MSHRRFRAPNAVFRLECRRRDGTVRWQARASNIVTDEGLDDALNKYLKGSSYTAAWYVIVFTSASDPAAGWTAASNGTEFTAYDEATRQALVLGVVSGQSVSNVLSKAVITIAAAGEGVVLRSCGLISDATKGGASGVLYDAAVFDEGNKTVSEGDTVTLAVTLTTADDGA